MYAKNCWYLWQWHVGQTENSGFLSVGPWPDEATRLHFPKRREEFVELAPKSVWFGHTERKNDANRLFFDR